MQVCKLCGGKEGFQNSEKRWYTVYYDTDGSYEGEECDECVDTTSYRCMGCGIEDYDISEMTIDETEFEQQNEEQKERDHSVDMLDEEL